jgi:hypothetical protein
LIPEKLKTTRLKKRRKSKANENNNKKKLCLGKNKEQFPSPHIKDRRGNKNKEEKRPGEQEHIILKCEGRKAKKSGRTYGEGGLGGSSYQEPSDIHVLEGLKSTRKILKIEGGQLNSKNHPYLFRLTLSLSLSTLAPQNSHIPPRRFPNIKQNESRCENERGLDAKPIRIRNNSIIRSEMYLRPPPPLSREAAGV